MRIDYDQLRKFDANKIIKLEAEFSQAIRRDQEQRRIQLEEKKQRRRRRKRKRE